MQVIASDLVPPGEIYFIKGFSMTQPKSNQYQECLTESMRQVMLKRVYALSERIGQVTAEMDDRLSPVMMPTPSCAIEQAVAAPRPPMPPMFADLDEGLGQIEMCVAQMSSMIDRLGI